MGRTRSRRRSSNAASMTDRCGSGIPRCWVPCGGGTLWPPGSRGGQTGASGRQRPPDAASRACRNSVLSLRRPVARPLLSESIGRNGAALRLNRQGRCHLHVRPFLTIHGRDRLWSRALPPTQPFLLRAFLAFLSRSRRRRTFSVSWYRCLARSRRTPSFSSVRLSHLSMRSSDSLCRGLTLTPKLSEPALPQIGHLPGSHRPTSLSNAGDGNLSLKRV